jgi:hypothetical protein
VHPLTSGHDPVNGLDGDCVAAIAQQALATPLSFECAVLTRLVPEHFGKMWKVKVIGELCAYDLHSRMDRNSKRNWETSKTP